MALVDGLLFFFAGLVAVVTLLVTLASSSERIKHVARVAIGLPEGLPPLPPHRRALRPVRVVRATSVSRSLAAA